MKPLHKSLLNTWVRYLLFLERHFTFTFIFFKIFEEIAFPSNSELSWQPKSYIVSFCLMSWLATDILIFFLSCFYINIFTHIYKRKKVLPTDIIYLKCLAVKKKMELNKEKERKKKVRNYGPIDTYFEKVFRETFWFQ